MFGKCNLSYEDDTTGGMYENVDWFGDCIVKVSVCVCVLEREKIMFIGRICIHDCLTTISFLSLIVTIASYKHTTPSALITNMRIGTIYP